MGKRQMGKRARPKHKANFQRACARKKRYQYGGEARSAALLVERRTSEAMHHYYCVYCQGYHIGHVAGL